MQLKSNDVLVVTERIRLSPAGWEVCSKYDKSDKDSEMQMGDKIIFSHFHWTDGPEFDPDCGLNFDCINGDPNGPEFSSEEVHRFLKDGVLEEVDE